MVFWMWFLWWFQFHLKSNLTRPMGTIRSRTLPKNTGGFVTPHLDFVP